MVRTVAASFFPFAAAVLCTTTGKRPVIMKGPDDRNIVFYDVIEQHFNVDIIITKGMKMNEIWFDFIKPLGK